MTIIYLKMLKKEDEISSQQVPEGRRKRDLWLSVSLILFSDFWSHIFCCMDEKNSQITPYR